MNKEEFRKAKKALYMRKFRMKKRLYIEKAIKAGLTVTDEEIDERIEKEHSK